nr:MAG TPA: hypothetical protein [Caudoviricetes sp.]DAV84010.1 MAG TPA: hypothetical protein [Bacteriophage sp.]
MIRVNTQQTPLKHVISRFLHFFNDADVNDASLSNFLSRTLRTLRTIASDLPNDWINLVS